MQENMEFILNEELYFKKADPLLAVSCFINNEFTSTEIINSLNFYNNGIAKENLEEIISNQLKFLAIIEEFNKNNYINFVLLLKDYIINNADQMSLHFIIILAEKAVASILAILAAYNQVYNAYLIPTEMSKHIDEVKFKKSNANEETQAGDKFFKIDPFIVMLEIFDVLLEKTIKHINTDKQFEEIDEKTAKFFSSGLLDHSLMVWMSIFINAPLRHEKEISTIKLVESIQKLENYCHFKSLRYSILFLYFL